MRRYTILITSGPTREHIDPVRYISNASTGAMGCALAEAANRLGHRVIFITGPALFSSPRGARVIPVISARQMASAVVRHLPSADIVIGAAAVSDYRPLKRATHKTPKPTDEGMLRLVPNPDIIAAAAERGRAVVIGFALETRGLIRRAKAKLESKGLDAIVANPATAIGAARTTAWIIRRGGKTTAVRHATKQALAERIIDEAIRLCEHRPAAEDKHRGRKGLAG